MTPPLLGRARELGALRGWLDDARSGHGRLVLCIGEAGIGKTRLCQELAGLAAGERLAWGRCVDTDGAPPFWPWREVLRGLGATEPTVGDVESPQDRFQAVDAVAGAVLTEVARRPLVVVLDDVHWAPSRRCSCCATSPTGSRTRRCCWSRRCASPSRAPPPPGRWPAWSGPRRVRGCTCAGSARRMSAGSSTPSARPVPVSTRSMTPRVAIRSSYGRLPGLSLTGRGSRGGRRARSATPLPLGLSGSDRTRAGWSRPARWSAAGSHWPLRRGW